MDECEETATPGEEPAPPREAPAIRGLAEVSDLAGRLYGLLSRHEWSEFDAEAATAVLDIDELAAGTVLDELADAGMLTRCEVSAGSSEEWWQLNDPAHARTVAGRALSPQELESATGKLLGFYADTASSARAAAAPYLDTPLPEHARVFSDRDAALAWLRSHHSVLVSAAGWAHQHGRHTDALAIVHGLWPLYLHDRPADWVATDQLGLAAARAGNDPAAVARMLDRLGAAHAHTGDEQAALARFTEANKLWEQLDNPHKIAGSLRRCADVAVRQGRYDDAIEQFHHGIAQHRGLGEPRAMALGLIGLGDALNHAGRPSEALTAASEATAIFTDQADAPHADPYNAARARLVLAAANSAQGELDEAWDLLSDARRQMRAAASPHGQAMVAAAIAELARRTPPAT